VGKIYSGKGDEGKTDLPGGVRTPKDDLRLEVCGALDELQSALGLARAQGLPQPLEKILLEVQRHLCIVAAEVSGAEVVGRGLAPIGPKHVQALESWIDEYTSRGALGSGFILLGGCVGAAHLDFARAVCRRVERRLVSLLRESPQAVFPPVMAYLNRLSDLLFVLARVANAETGRGEAEFRPC